MKKIDLTKGKVIIVLTKLAVPIMGTSLLQFTYNLVDMLWVGRLGSNAVASVGSSSFFIALGYALNSLVITGTSIKVAHSLGKNDEINVKKYINSGLLLNLALSVIYGLILIFFGKNLISFLRLKNAIVEQNSYLYLVMNGPIMFFSFFNVLYTKIVGSFGNNNIALKISTVGIIINIVLDPVFIYTLNLGVLGAAFATLIANIVMFLLYKNKAMEFLRYDFNISIDYKKFKEIIQLGTPMSLQRVLFTLINIILARIIARFGSNAIAAQKIGLQIESVMFMVIGGLNGAIASFTGQNYGAQKHNRVIQGFKAAIYIGVTYSFIMTVIFIVYSNQIANLFIKDSKTSIIISSYLQIISLSQIFSTLEMILNGLFTGLGMPRIPALISILFTALRIPISLVLINFIGLEGIWISISLSSILKGLVSYIIYSISVRKELNYVRDY